MKEQGRRKEPRSNEYLLAFLLVIGCSLYPLDTHLCRCQKQVEDNVQGLVNKMVETEVEDMKAFQPPEVDMDNHYYTTVGITLFQMVEQNVSILHICCTYSVIHTQWIDVKTEDVGIEVPL